MKEGKIQTLHPVSNKTNKIIDIAKYEIVKKAILEILTDKCLSHTDLMESIYQKVQSSLEGNANWYGETVKLDLEARKIISRNADKPPIYSINKNIQ